MKRPKPKKARVPSERQMTKLLARHTHAKTLAYPIHPGSGSVQLGSSFKLDSPLPTTHWTSASHGPSIYAPLSSLINLFLIIRGEINISGMMMMRIGA